MGPIAATGLKHCAAAMGGETSPAPPVVFNLSASSTLLRMSIGLVYVSLYAANSLLMKLSMDPAAGAYLYNPVAVTLLSDLIKLGVSVALLPYSATDADALIWKNLWPYSVPGLVYLIDDNLQYSIYRFLRPSEVTLWANVRVLTTAVIFRVIIKRRLSTIQWVLLFVLTAGLVTAQFDRVKRDGGGGGGGGTGGDLEAPPDGPTSGANSFFGLNFGHLILLVVAVVGSCGNVLGEFLLKKDLGHSLQVQNFKLYSWGALFNFVAYVTTESRNDRALNIGNFFYGFNKYTVALACTQACLGLTISVMFKYIDNIFKVQAGAIGFVVTVLLGSIILGNYPTAVFYVGAATVIASVYAYNHPSNRYLEPSPTSSPEDRC